MDVNIPILAIIALFILIALMAFIAIILSFINWLHTWRGMSPFAEIPKRLSLPLSQEEQILMRSWYSGGNISTNISGKCRWDRIPCRPIPLFWMPGRSDNPRLVSRDFPAHLRSPQVTAGDHSATGHAGHCKILGNPSGNHKCLWFRFPRQSGNLKGNLMVLIGKQKFHTSGNELIRNTGRPGVVCSCSGCRM